MFADKGYLLLDVALNEQKIFGVGVEIYALDSPVTAEKIDAILYCWHIGLKIFVTLVLLVCNADENMRKWQVDSRKLYIPDDLAKARYLIILNYSIGDVVVILVQVAHYAARVAE